MLKLALHWQILIAMIIGAVLGVLLNTQVGDYTTSEPVAVFDSSPQFAGMSDKAQVKAGTVWVQDSPSQVLIQLNNRVGEDTYDTRRVVVRSPLDQATQQWPALPTQADTADHEIPIAEYKTVSELKKKDSEAFAAFYMYGRSTGRTVGDFAKLIGDLFLRMLKMVSVPLIIVSLISGVTGLGKAERLGKMFGRTLTYYIVTSMLAIITGLVMVNLFQPGKQQAVAAQAAQAEAQDADAPDAEEGTANAKQRREGKGLGTVLFEQLQNMIPTNPFHALSSGNFLSIIAFSILFGVFTILVGGAPAQLMTEFFGAAFQIVMKMTMAIIHLAPIGVLFLMLSATAHQGVEVFATLGWYMVTVFVALAFHAMVTMPILLRFVARRNPWHYAKSMSPALLTAFSSASSNGTLPLTMTCVETRAGVSNRVGSFVLPLGATVNMDGTALYEVVAVLFIAQFSGLDLSLAQQVTVAFTALLASIGAAGIPHAGLVMMVIVLQAVGLPTEAQGMIIAVDRVLDMCRTSVNVWSDSCGCAVIERFEDSE